MAERGQRIRERTQPQQATPLRSALRGDCIGCSIWWQVTKHVALVMSLNKRIDRKVIEGVTRFVRDAGDWSVFVEDAPQAKIPNFLHGNFDGVIADLDDTPSCKARIHACST